MRKFAVILGMILTFTGLFAGCGTEEVPEYRTMVYRQVFEHLDGLETLRVSNTVRTENGYSYLYGTGGQSGTGQSGIFYVQADADGNILSEMPLTEYGEDFGDALFLGERGIYVWGLWDDEEEMKSYRSLIRYSFDGEQEAWADITVLREKGNSNDTADSGKLFAERDEGIALIWNDTCILADDNFVRTGAFELPGTACALFVDGAEFWIVYKKGTGMNLGRFTEDGTETESYVLPERFHSNEYPYRGVEILSCRDGCLTAWDSEGVYRWKLTAEPEEEPVFEEIMDFLDAGIPAEYVQNVSWIPGEYDGEFMVAERAALQKMYFLQRLYRPDPTIDLSTIETLTLACIQPESSLTQAVVEFNKSHTDVRIEVLDYSIYNTEKDWGAGRTKLMLDLTTGVLQPDIVFLVSFDFQELVDAADGYFIDLYTLMDGKVTPDTIYGCVKNTLEDEDGRLYGIVPEFMISTVAGRRDTIGDMETWSIPEFLDFAESLGEGEYLMEEISQTNAEYTLFNFLGFVPFIRDGEADFLDPDYLRLLEFTKSLPTEPQLYMDHGSSNLDALFAGEITLDQVEVDAGGENLYHNGKIKLADPGVFQSPSRFMKAAYQFGVTSPTELNYIGCPVDDRCGSGVELGFNGGIYAIPSYCRDVETAWEFIESRLTADDYRTYFENSHSDEIGAGYFFKTYKPDYDEYLDALEGYQAFYFHGENGSVGGFDTADKLDGDGRYNGRPGTLVELDRAAIGEVKNMLDTAGIPLWYSLLSRTELRNIINEEISRYLSGNATAESTADVIQSRVSIWLSEHE